LPDFPFARGRYWLVGSVGRLADVKNHAFLVRAFARAVKSGAPRAQDLRLVLAGDGPMRAGIETLLQQEGIRDSVWLAGNRDDVPAIMRSLDCFVLPSYAEGTSCTLQEAMASGLPIVATAVGGTPQLIGDDAGSLVQPDDDAALAEKILAYAADPVLAATHGVNARARAARDFDIARAIERYRELFAGDWTSAACTP